MFKIIIIWYNVMNDSDVTLIVVINILIVNIAVMYSLFKNSFFIFTWCIFIYN